MEEGGGRRAEVGERKVGGRQEILGQADDRIACLARLLRSVGQMSSLISNGSTLSTEQV